MTLSLDKFKDVSFISRLRGAGLVDAVLAVLSDCNGEFTIMNVLNASFMPSYWMQILHQIETPGECHVQIAERMGPIVYCLSNRERTFFQSNHYWHCMYPFFLSVIQCLVHFTPNDTIPILLKYQGFLKSIIQPVFWKSHNPEIAKELESFSLLEGSEEQLGDIDERGLDIVCHVIQHLTLLERVNGYDKVEWRPGGASVMENVATTLVGGETVFVEGLIHILPRLAKEYKGPAFRLLYLSVALDCVDKGVIKSAIEYAEQYSSANTDAVCITKLLGMILMPSKTGKCYPDDTRFGVAIGHGLLQVCLELLAKFRHSDVGNAVENDVNEIVLGASMVVFLNKTSKAVSIQRESILESLKRFEAVGENEKGAPSSKTEVSIIPTINLIVYLSSKFQKSRRPMCYGCKALLEKGKVKQCATCKVVVYVSLLFLHFQHSIVMCSYFKPTVLARMPET